MDWPLPVLFALLLPAAGAGVVLAMRLARSRVSAVEPVGAGGVWRVRNLYLDLYAARAGSKIVLFDAGLDPAGAPIDALLRALDARREDVSDIFLTHGHPDHVAGVPLLPSARVHAGAADRARLFHDTGPATRRERLTAAVFPAPRVEVDDPLVERVEIPVGNHGDRVLAIPMPGHTAGAFAYVFRGVLIAGDAMHLHGHDAAPSPASACDDPARGRASLLALFEELHGVRVDVLCTSRGGCSEPGEAPEILERLTARLRARPRLRISRPVSHV